MSSLKLPETTKAVLRRISKAVNRPMVRVLPAIIEAYAKSLDPAKVCSPCKDKDFCSLCPFNTRQFNEDIASILGPLNYRYEKEVSRMKPNQVSVLISKKIGKNFCSWSVSHGVTAELEDEDHFREALITLDAELKALVSQSLPTDFKPVAPLKELPSELPAISDLGFTTS